MHLKMQILFPRVIIESTGAIHPRMIREIQSLVTLSDQRQPIHHSFTIRNSFQYWTHYISISAVRGTMGKLIEARKNAQSILVFLMIIYFTLFMHSQSPRLFYFLINTLPLTIHPPSNLTALYRTHQQSQLLCNCLCRLNL